MNEPLPTPADEAAVLARRARLAAALTPAERLQRAAELQAAALALLRASPAAWDAFVRRNHHQRREHFHHGRWEPADPARRAQLRGLPDLAPR
jgi:hypothetical protein